MKKIRIKLLLKISQIILAILGFVGIISCDPLDPGGGKVCKYGIPSTYYQEKSSFNESEVKKNNNSLDSVAAELRDKSEK